MIDKQEAVKERRRFEDKMSIIEERRQKAKEKEEDRAALISKIHYLMESGMTITEIGNELDIPVSTVHSMSKK